MEMTPELEAELNAIYPRIFNVCLRITQSREEAQDLAGQTMVNALRGLRGFQGKSALYTWIYRIAVNLCKNRLKQIAREREVVGSWSSLDRPVILGGEELSQYDDTPDLMAEDPAVSFERQASRKIVVSALRSMGRRRPDYLAAIVAVDYEEMSYREVADKLGVTESAFRLRIYYARQMLKKRLTTAYENGGL